MAEKEEDILVRFVLDEKDLEGITIEIAEENLPVNQ
jgi:hypothetical protein